MAMDSSRTCSAWRIVQNAQTIALLQRVPFFARSLLVLRDDGASYADALSHRLGRVALRHSPPRRDEHHPARGGVEKLLEEDPQANDELLLRSRVRIKSMLCVRM